MGAIDGKKSYIGLVIYGIGQGITMAGNVELGEAISKVGELMLGIGVVHKLAKLEGGTQ